MSYQELVEAARRLQMSEQLQLIEELLRAFRVRIQDEPQPLPDAAPMSALRGALKPDNGVTQRVLGIDKGRVVIRPDFYEPLAEFAL